jgi:polysaccharide biosynthesis/export protein VpsN
MEKVMPTNVTPAKTTINTHARGKGTQSFIHTSIRVNLSGFIFSMGILILTALASPAANAALERYRLSADDTIAIAVYNEPDLSLAKIRIATNGTIAIALLGQIKVSGLTIGEIETKITTLFADGYLKNPAITVSIVEYRPFYVNGEVKKPGGYSYRDGLTVHKAVTLAGGFSERASRDNIIILPEDSAENAAIRVKLSDRIRPGDIITVKESFF